MTLLHASCAVRDDIGVLIRGPAGSGKSNLLLRLLGRGFDLVADDCVLVVDDVARAPDRLRGLIEVRGLGIFRRRYRDAARVGLVVEAGVPAARIPEPRRFPGHPWPVLALDLLAPASPDVVGLAVEYLAGKVAQVAGPL